jgi:nucleotide-binding universal stress UspA family protein
MPLRRRRSTVVPPVRRILVGTDGSETAERAVAWAAEMAARYSAELLLVSVVAEQDGGAEASLAERARELAGERGRAHLLVDDSPARALLGAARSHDVDVIVVGSVGMSGRREFLLDNVPNRVSHNAPCTVVIVDTLGRRR